MKATILITEDDPDVRELISGILAGEGHRILSAKNAAEFRALEKERGIDLYLMDLALPDDNGLALAKEIRDRSDAGIIIVSGRTSETDHVLGLEFGADDYVTKPFRPRELVARVNAVLRRRKIGTSHNGNPHGVEGRTVLGFCGWQFDLAARNLRSPEGTDTPLTTAEFELLRALADAPQRVHTRDSLLNNVHGREWAGFDRGIDGLVSRLRKKIEPDPRHPEIIKTIRGVGYIFSATVTKL